jgi:hypothetical protein
MLAGWYGLFGGQRLPLLGNTKEVRQLLWNAFRYLADGNWAIYMDIYPTTLAYLDPSGGIPAVKKLRPPPALLDAWIRLDAARDNQDDDEIWAAAVDMVDYEQRFVLQQAIAQTAEQREFWTTFTQNYGSRIKAPYPGARPFKVVIPAGDYGDDEARMIWFKVELYPVGKEWLRSHPDGINVQSLLDGDYH